MIDKDQSVPNDEPNDSEHVDHRRDAEILEAYREVAELCRWIPGEGQEAVEARLKLFNAFNRLAEAEESAGQHSKRPRCPGIGDIDHPPGSGTYRK